jgi:MYXO-CTERM domain-containing protein
MRWAALLLLAASVGERAAEARPVRVGGAGISGSGPSLDTAFSVPAGPDRYLVVGLSIPGSGLDVVSVTWAQSPLARIASQNTPAGQCRAELWGLVGPATGAHSLTVTTSAASAIKGGIMAYDAVDPVISTGGWQWATGASAMAAVSLTTGTGEQVVDSLCLGGTRPSVGAASAGQTELWRSSDGTLAATGSERPASMGSVTMGWTVSPGADVGWAIAAMSLRPSGAVVVLDGGASLDASAPPDGGLATDAGADLAPDAPPPGDGPAGAEAPAEAAAPMDAPADERPAVLDAPASDGSTSGLAVADLRVGCACRTGNAPPPPAALVLLTTAAAIRLGRRRRTGSDRH